MSKHIWDHFSPFASHTHRLLGVLALGMEGKGSYTITASRHGLTLKSGKSTLARGKDGRELFRDLDAKLAELK